ncbi:hypothetical protein XaC1_303 [Xanthomonas phage XaC1]|nr:hypothetical protein XaC1_303 [Xanthomonas phage XaC1]
MKTLGEMARSIGSVIVEGNIGTFYHGSTHKISTFNDEFVGSGNDQLGPGIYFSSSLKDALGYSDNNGYIYEVQINLRNDLDMKSKVNPRLVKALIQASPDDYAWQNWSENKKQGIELGYRNTLEISDNMLEAIDNINGDWYRQYEKDFVRQLTKLGFDGSIHRNVNGSDSTWVVVYNPQAITLVKVHLASNLIKNGA